MSVNENLLPLSSCSRRNGRPELSPLGLASIRIPYVLTLIAFANNYKDMVCDPRPCRQSRYSCCNTILLYHAFPILSLLTHISNSFGTRLVPLGRYEQEHNIEDKKLIGSPEEAQRKPRTEATTKTGHEGASVTQRPKQ